MSKNVVNLIMERVGPLLLEGRLEDVKAKFPPQSSERIDILSSKDPSGNNKYLDWMAKQTLRSIKYFKDNNRNFSVLNFNNTEDPGWDNVYFGYFDFIINEQNRLDLFDNIEYFHENPTKFEKRDINQYTTIQELDEAVELAKQKLSRREEKNDGVDKLFEDENFTLLVPKTHKASCRYGSNTRWCITMRGYSGYFENYMSSGVVFFLIDKRRLEPTSSLKTKDYYKIAFQYRPLNGQLRADGLNARTLAERLGKDAFVNGANVSNSDIDYWNVLDHNKPESTVKKYIGGPGRGQKQRTEYYMPLFKNLMSNYVKDILGKYYDSLNEPDTDINKVENLKSEIRTIEDNWRDIEGSIEVLENIIDHVNALGEYSNLTDLVGGVDITKIESKFSELTGILRGLENEHAIKVSELNDINRKREKKLHFYDVEKNVPQK